MMWARASCSARRPASRAGRPRPHHRHTGTGPTSRRRRRRARRRRRRPHRRPHHRPGPHLMRGNPENLRLAAARKSAAAKTRADQGLQEIIRLGQPVTFRALAQTAGVSLDFLYRTPEIRSRVEHLRAKQQTSPPAPTPRADPDQPSSVVATLTAQLLTDTLNEEDRDGLGEWDGVMVRLD